MCRTLFTQKGVALCFLRSGKLWFLFLVFFRNICGFRLGILCNAPVEKIANSIEKEER
jgi:hypothetical protein